MRHLKALGLAMLAAFALSAVAAAGASAQHNETPEPNPEIGFAPTVGDNVGLETIETSDQIFQVTGQESFFNCTNADFTSHEDFDSTKPVNPLTVVPDYEDPEVAKDCFAETEFGQFNVIVDENDCDFEFFAQTHNEQAGDFEGDAYVDCTKSEVGHIQITIPAIGCTYNVGTNTLTPVDGDKHSITYTNVTHGDVEAVTVEVKGEVTYTHTGGFCTGPAEGEAEYTGHAVVGGIDTDEPEETVDIGVTTIE